MYVLKTSPIFQTKQGFTLAEILVSIFLLSMITLGVTTTLQQATHLSLRVNTRQASLFSGQIAIEKLRRDLQMTFSEDVQGGETTFLLRESTHGSDLLFSYLESPIKRLFIRRTAGTKNAYYTLEKNDNGTSDLIRREAPIGDRQELQRQDDFQVLAQGVLDFKVEAYDPRNDQWKKEWDDKGRVTGGYFPQAVMVTIETVDPEMPKDKWKDSSVVFQTKILLLNQMDES